MSEKSDGLRPWVLTMLTGTELDLLRVESAFSPISFAYASTFCSLAHFRKKSGLYLHSYEEGES